MKRSIESNSVNHFPMLFKFDMFSLPHANHFFADIMITVVLVVSVTGVKASIRRHGLFSIKIA